NGEIATTAPAPTPEPAKPPEHTFDDAVDYYKRTRAVSALKPSTRHAYTEVLDRVLVPRFGKRQLAKIDVAQLAEVDACLVKDELSASSRRNVHIVLRSVLRAAKEAGLLAELPPFPKLPKVGRTVLKSLTRVMVDAILAVASPSARLAFALAAFAGL